MAAGNSKNAAPGRPFQPGESGNPDGRPTINRELAASAREFTPEILKRLKHWLGSDSYKASLGAASILLDRGYGKPTQYIEVEDSTIRELAEEFSLAPEQVRRDLAEQRKHLKAV